LIEAARRGTTLLAAATSAASAALTLALSSATTALTLSLSLAFATLTLALAPTVLASLVSCGTSIRMISRRQHVALNGCAQC